MKTEKAKLLNTFVNQALSFYVDFYVYSSNDSPIKANEKERWSKTRCQEVYTAFLDELRDNILRYAKLEIIYDYVVACLGKLENWDGFLMVDNVQIIQLNYEIEFLIEFKDSLTTIVHNINGLLEMDENDCPYQLWLIYTEVLDIKAESSNSVEGYQPLFDLRFDFEMLKAACDALTSSYERIKLINDRLIDLQQWEIQYDVELEGLAGFGVYKFSPQYYPNFNQLCKIELNRQEKILEIERKLPVHTIPIQSEQPMIALPAKYVWNAKDTDLLELSCSLCLENAIGRADGAKMTRKELIGLFENLFGMEIKDAEGKLNKATNRNDKTPFLDKLRSAFHHYCREKDEKLRVRG